ncbi:10059_t:CDS:2 [Diversispora eburnea]|uniref:10059_t:CDS:1 n=1 Tax=Diversispora eburnea TaxID=1213867 RepID=A0A9N9BBW4_9GLOM|nr:10059_t:CDS:2 [Diversispora eburnea]
MELTNEVNELRERLDDNIIKGKDLSIFCLKNTSERLETEEKTETAKKFFNFSPFAGIKEGGFGYEATKQLINDSNLTPEQVENAYHLNKEKLKKEYPDAVEENNCSIGAQAYLDKHYPEEKKGNITELNLRDKNLRGSLKLENFTKLRKLDCSDNRTYDRGKITSLEIIDCPKLERIDCYGNNITELKIGKLDNLARLCCSNNQLREIDINVCPNLKEFDCSDNYLVNLDLSKNRKLWRLNIENNNFAEQDLSFLSHLANLKGLRLRNRLTKLASTDLYYYEKLKKERQYQENLEKKAKNIYNRFTGSLKPLKNLTKLENLYIENTNLDSGLEYLPESVRMIFCAQDNYDEIKGEAEVRKIEDELLLYG